MKLRSALENLQAYSAITWSLWKFKIKEGGLISLSLTLCQEVVTAMPWPSFLLKCLLSEEKFVMKHSCGLQTGIKDVRVQQTLHCLNRHQEVMAIACVFYVLLEIPAASTPKKWDNSSVQNVPFVNRQELFASPTDNCSFPLSEVTSQLVASLTTLYLSLEVSRHGKYTVPLQCCQMESHSFVREILKRV